MSNSKKKPSVKLQLDGKKKEYIHMLNLDHKQFLNRKPDPAGATCCFSLFGKKKKK